VKESRGDPPGERQSKGGAIGQSDVTAVVLTLGEETTESALASVHRQSAPPADVVVLEGVKPIYEAVNVAASRASATPFFVQVDADMILDSDCFAALRAAVRPEVGIVTGALRDPLAGTINGVKLFRRECFEATRCKNVPAWESDFYMELVEHGWVTVNVLAQPERFERVGHTFGEHRPEYTPAYTYSTYYLLGRKYSLRVNGAARIRWRLDRLRACPDPVALIARAAFGHGIFSGLAHDMEKRALVADDELLEGIVQANGAVRPLPPELIDGAPERVSDAFYALGRALRIEHGYATLRSWMQALASAPPDVSWVAEASLHHGFLAVTAGSGESEQVHARLRDLLQPEASRAAARGRRYSSRTQS
jgi:hypothetical protein